jgi:hypothetical protein
MSPKLVRALELRARLALRQPKYGAGLAAADGAGNHFRS